MGALLSPALYRDFLLENERRYCGSYRYTLTHLHPSSFHLLDDILSNENLKAVEINKDSGGPTVKEMLPFYLKVLESKRCLVIWGDLNEEELQLVIDNVPLKGVFFNLVLPDCESAKRIQSFLNSRSII